MAELVLAALLPVVFEKLASAALKELARYEGLVAEIEKCKDWLELIQGVLTQASQMKTTNPAVKPWLKNLQHLAYDIDDVFDGWLTEAMQRNFTHDSEDITNKVRKKLIPTCCTNFSSCTNKMHGKLRQINARLELLARQRNDLDLKVKEETRPQNNNTNIGLIRPSAVSPSTTVGRTAEKVEFVQKLLVDNPSDQNFSIVPIVGMAGVGKTNLANFLYNEKKVKNHFAPNMVWVQVSGEFDIIGISQEIFEAVGGEATKAPRNFNKLQEALRDKLSGKRFLLVLDDVWSESHRDWETLVGPFYTCAPGSKIVITTEKDKLFQNLGNKPLIKQLGSLPHVDALSLFAFHALGVTNFDSHLSLKPYADDIVKKCDGLPLALIALGKSLNSKEDEASWKKVLESEIWQLPAEGAALRVSYDDLPTPLKQLFAYCSLFPKGYMFDKDELVALWMAEGFLNESTSNDEIESLGHKYFDELLSRSFFQHAPDNESMFVMHALMNDLATFVAGEFYLRFDNETEKRNRENMMEKYRHISFVREEYVNYKKFETFKKAKSSRTFLALEKSRQHSFLSNKVLANLLPHLPLLRVLSLSNFNISEVPESIGTLRHLRYLNLSQTRITHLPESVCNLYNLQTLIVFGCSRLIELPKSFVKLKNLRHLDIRDTHVFNHIPLEIGEFKSLQTLSNIIIGAEGGFEITKLKDLENICGKISMVGLDKVKDATCASEANLSVKRISELQVEWSDVLDGPRDKELEKEVLNELKPHKDYLQQLKIGSYMGLEFPIWVGDPSFGGLKHVSIRGCKNCTSLPPLGQLPLLKELFVEGFERVTVVGMEFLGTSLSFKSLEILSFVDMPGWGKWSTNNRVVLPYLRQWGKWSTDSGVVFPKLRQLRIRDCPNLVEVLLEALPLLKVLEIVGCDSVVLKKLVQVASSVTKLDICHISRLIDVEWRDVIKNLRAVEELTITDCNAMRYLWESEAVASKFFVKLRKLKVDNCDNMVRLGEKEVKNYSSNFLSSLTMLDVCRCKNMERCSCPGSIDNLIVYECTSLTVISLPSGGQKLKSLYISGCKKLSEREWGGHEIMNNTRSMPMLEVIDINDWPDLKSITELKVLVHLTTLKLINCGSLESFPDNELSNLTLLKYLHITDCPSMDASFPNGVWPPNLHSLTIGKLKKPISQWGTQDLPNSVVELYLHGDDGVVSSSQFANFLSSSITHLEVIAFEKLESFSMGLERLNSLQHLTCFKCPNLMDLPKELLHSLLSLKVLDCPKLEKRCSKRGRGRGSYWRHISHIPYISIGSES